MRLDLGAIGKGYAVDRTAEILNASGIHRAYIDAGGSTIYALGAPPGGTAWRVRLRDPSRKLGPEVMLRNNSVSTSEQSAPSSLQGDAPGHIIRSEEHTSELQSRLHLVCRLLLEKKKNHTNPHLQPACTAHGTRDAAPSST